MRSFPPRPDLVDCSALREDESEAISRLFDDTADLLDADDFALTLELIVQRGSALLFDALAAELAAHHDKKKSESGENSFVSPAEIRLPFARHGFAR